LAAQKPNVGLFLLGNFKLQSAYSKMINFSNSVVVSCININFRKIFANFVACISELPIDKTQKRVNLNKKEAFWSI